jgi:hypothetical protein
MELNDLLHDLENRRFFGSVELKFESGRVVLIRKSETLKPTENCCRDNRGTPDEHKP